MRRFLSIFVLLTSLVSCHRQETMESLTERVFKTARAQLTAMDAQLDEQATPRSFENGVFIPAGIRWWCSGFYPGSLWYVYEYTGDEAIRSLAEKHTLRLDSIQWVTTDHDVGFQLNCSYGNALRLTGEEPYRRVLRQGALSLATRFNSATGTLRSWDFVRKGRDWQFPVIIDNMMNLELLLSVAEAYDDNRLREIACTHANTTMRNHFREDGTCFHLVDYSPEDGHVRSRQTVQGYADGSAWARGQAWALYGYTMMFRKMGYQSYLTQAFRVADMLLDRLPADGIPYWDFDAPGIPDAPRDASAAAIMASAFIELSQYVPEDSVRERLLATAECQLRTLASPEYLAEVGTNGCFLLKHSVGSLPDAKEVDVPLTYADYYFLEALLRYRTIVE